MRITTDVDAQPTPSRRIHSRDLPCAQQLQLALALGVAASTLNRLLLGQSGVSPEMALRLSKTLGRSPESWLAMQDQYDLWQARQTLDLGNVREMAFA
jgi:antitoxin HigA-1